MEAIRQANMTMYNKNPKGKNDPKIGKYDEKKLSTLAKIMIKQTKEDLKIGKRSPLDPYKGPHITSFLVDKTT